VQGQQKIIDRFKNTNWTGGSGREEEELKLKVEEELHVMANGGVPPGNIGTLFRNPHSA
jgi:hypothetical protein